MLAKQSKAWWVVIYIFFHSNGLVEQGYDVHKISIKYFRPFNFLISYITICRVNAQSRSFNLHTTNLKFFIIIQLQYQDWLSRQLVFQMVLSCVKRLKITENSMMFSLKKKRYKGLNNTSILAPIKNLLLQFTSNFSVY